MRKKILIADDDPDILDVLNLTLDSEYDITMANDGVEAVEKARKRPPDLIICDFKMPRMEGPQVCEKLKEDALLKHIPIIMLTGKKETQDKITGINAGADDYLIKPFDPDELLARVKMIMRRTEQNLDANPLTRLPGNVSIFTEIEKHINKKDLFAVCYIDLDKFKVYNDKYGFERGDEVIRSTARILIETSTSIDPDNCFVGHIGGDDFVIITIPNLIDRLCSEIIKNFDKLAPTWYNDEDRARGYIEGIDRQGNPIKTTFISVSIGVVTNVKKPINHIAEVGQIGAELKKTAKSEDKSNYIVDQRI